MTTAPREQWGSRFGFIMAAVGSAVGLGNMWRFPYFAAENGGAAFVFLYLLMTLLVGLPIMLAEMTLGRGSGKSPVEALKHFGGPAWKFLGFVFVAAGFIIFSYYSVIAGWTLRYFLASLTGGIQGSTGEYFTRVSSGWGAIAGHLAFIGATIAVVAGGVKSGIERVAMVLMPLLFAVVLAIAGYAYTLEGSGAGYAYYLDVDFSQIWSAQVLSEATGQAFYSLSLGMGAMLTFSSYLRRDTCLPREALTIAGSDFAVAFVGGLMVFPLIFAFGLRSEVTASSIGALFITMPKVFQEMGGSAGTALGILFFGALAVGALTSTISLLEVVTSTAIDSLGWKRRQAAIGMGLLIALLGIPSALSTDVLGLMDTIAEGQFLVLGALGISVFVGYVMKDPIGEVACGAERVRWFPIWRNLLRFVVSPLLLFVLVYRLRATYDQIRVLIDN